MSVESENRLSNTKPKTWEKYREKALRVLAGGPLGKKDISLKTGIYSGAVALLVEKLLKEGVLTSRRGVGGSEKRASYHTVYELAKKETGMMTNGQNGHVSGAVNGQAKPGGVRAVLYHGDETYLARNRIVEKLEQRGVRVAKVHFVRKFCTDVSSIVDAETDVVLVLEDSLTPAAISSAKRLAGASGLPAFVLRHNVAHPTWASLSTWVGARFVSQQPPPLPRLATPVPLSAKLGDFVESVPAVPVIPAPTAKPSTVAEKVAASISENEELTRLAMEAEARAKSELEALRREMGEMKLQLDAARAKGGVVIREQLVDDLARKERERAQAVRDLHESQQKFNAQLEVEQERVRRVKKDGEQALAEIREERDKLAQTVQSLILKDGSKPTVDPVSKKVLWLVEGWLDDTLDAETAKEALRRALRP